MSCWAQRVKVGGGGEGCGSGVYTWPKDTCAQHLALWQNFNLIYAEHMKLFSIWDLFSRLDKYK